LARSDLPLYILSVVPAQTALWQPHGTVLGPIPLGNAYAGLGADRACALWGALKVYGQPALVIDAGTALTLTGADAQGHLVGGAILPGLGLQFQSLGQATALLPDLRPDLRQNPKVKLPDRWATNTPEAMNSGVLWTLVAGLNGFIEDWLGRFPDSKIVLTGGDADRLCAGLSRQHPEQADAVIVDPNLVFWGMRDVAWSNCQRGRSG
jgi:type III pantothenate kinase